MHIEPAREIDGGHDPEEIEDLPEIDEEPLVARAGESVEAGPVEVDVASRRDKPADACAAIIVRSGYRANSGGATRRLSPMTVDLPPRRLPTTFVSV